MSSNIPDKYILSGGSFGSVYGESEIREAIAIAEVTKAINASLGSDYNNWNRLQTIGDLVATYAYLDPGTSDERVQTITYTSVSLGISATETYGYAGSSGAYRITTITRS